MGTQEKTRLTRVEAKEQTRQALLSAAREVFEDRGFHGASLEAVAERAGYTKGAVYSAFASKGDLFLAVYEQRSQQRAAVALAESRPERAREQSIDEFARILNRERPWSLALLEFWLHAAREPGLRDRFRALHRTLHDAFGSATGSDPLTQEVILAFGNGVLLEAIADPELDAERVLRHGAEIIQRGQR